MGTLAIKHRVKNNKETDYKSSMIDRWCNDGYVQTLVHAFISSRLDYCNSLLFGVSVVLLRKVQSVQNAAA